MAPNELQDPLVAELNGAAVMTNVDVQPDAPAPDPLEIQPAALRATAVQTSDARHSTAAGGKGYRVTVAGEFFAQSADTNVKIRKPYRLDFNVPSLEGCLGLIVGKLLLPALKKRHADCVNYRTHEIVDTKPLSSDTPESRNLAYMPRPALERYVHDNSVPLNPAEYPETVDLRAAIMDHALNPMGFEAREKLKQADRAETVELAAMNPGVL